MRSQRAFESFKTVAIKLNDGNEPDKAFWLKQLDVISYKAGRSTKSQYKVLFYLRLNYVVRRGDDYTPAWAETNKEWLVKTGLFSAWAEHRASPEFVRRGGRTGEVKGRDAAVRKALNERLQCEEFDDDDDGKRYRVLSVRWSEDVRWDEGCEPEPQFVALCYEARLADPHANQKNSRYISRMEDDSVPMSIEEVEDLIARTPKRART